MPKIHRLSAHDAQKIAAGQVIERPADIIKELVENALDAQSTHITVYVEDAGKKLIRVVDDGCGMDTIDARMCFEKHATSKLRTIEQLDNLSTFGFRGEAMPSIAAVCKVTLITRTADTAEGIKVCVQENAIQSTDIVPAPIGTDISATDLFYNMPARQKFLKKTDTEWRHVLQLMQAFCLDYPSIHFKVIADGKQLLHCPAVDSIVNRFAQLWDHTLSGHMLPVEAKKESGNLSITGAISDHQQFRFDRSGIFIFINNRWVKNFKLTNALIKGYMNVAPAGRYPIACIALTIDPTLVDINIHPRKEEVSFVHPVVVENFIKDTVKARLEENVSAYIRPAALQSLSPLPASAKASSFAKAMEDKTADRRDEREKESQFFDTFTHTSSTSLPAGKIGRPTQPELTHTSGEPTPTYIPFNFDAPIEKKYESEKQASLPARPEWREAAYRGEQHNFHLIGQYHNTYLLIEQQDGLFLVDQHAAHERILYERFGARFEDITTVSLLFPQLIAFSPQDIASLDPFLPLLQQFGIHLEQFGTNQLKITALPIAIKDINMRDFLEQVVGWISENSNLNEGLLTDTIHEKIRAQMACKAAVKAGDVLTQQQMNQLLLDLHNSENRLTCPHGRPTGWLLSLHEIEKRFKRKT
jgi:DNA mismatch repair protein MutL